MVDVGSDAVFVVISNGVGVFAAYVSCCVIVGILVVVDWDAVFAVVSNGDDVLTVYVSCRLPGSCRGCLLCGC